MEDSRPHETVSPKPSPLTGAQRAVAGLSLLLVFIGVGSLTRSGVALYYTITLHDLRMSVSWTYLAASSLFWGGVLTVAALSLTRQRRWSWWLTLIAATGYQAHRWIDRLLFDASDYARQVLPRDLLLTALFLALVWGVLCWPRVREIFD